MSEITQPMNTELWWSYLADYDGVPGSTVINLALKARAPIRDRTALLVTGVSFSSRPEKLGLPDASELDSLNRLSTKRLNMLRTHSPSLFAGAFTHKNERLDYIYVADPAGLEEALRRFYVMECPTRQPYINLKRDPQWEVYSGFLYPNAQILEHNRTELIKLGVLKPQ